MNHAGERRTDQRHTLQALVQVIEERDRKFQNAVQVLGLHLVSVAAPEIAEPVPLVLSAVEPDHEQSTGLQIFVERLDGGFAIRRVMENANAVDDVEALGREGQGEDIGLESNEVAVGKIFGGHFGGGAQVNAHHVRAPAGRNLGKASHAATYVEDQSALQIFGSESGLCQEMALRFADLIVVELCLLIAVPLETETGGIMLRIHKTRDALQVGISALAGRTRKAAGLIAFEFPAAVQAT